MSIGLALLVSTDPLTIGKVSIALEEFSLSPDVCRGMQESIRLLNRRKFEAVIVDLQLGEECGLILDEVHVSPSNRTAVTFAIGGSDVDSTASFRRKTSFVFERPLSMQFITIFSIWVREKSGSCWRMLQEKASRLHCLWQVCREASTVSTAASTALARKIFPNYSPR